MTATSAAPALAGATRTEHRRPGLGTVLALRFFEPTAQKDLRRRAQLPVRLQRAGSPLVPLAFVARVHAVTALAAAATLLLSLAVLLASEGLPEWRLTLALLLLPLLVASGVYGYQMLAPDLQARARRRAIEDQLSHALNFMAALASAGVVPVRVFSSLAQQPAYGEVSREAATIVRDVQLFSMDLVGALQAAARRSPSPQLEEFLQGCINTVTSGGDLSSYILAKAEHFALEARQKQKSFLESLAVMAESYVVVAAAAPLFLIVILSVMALLDPSVDPSLLLNLLVLVAVPVLHGMFLFILRSMRAD